MASASASDHQTIDTNCMTLNRFILQQQRNFPQATGDLTQLLNSIVTAVKVISAAVRRAGMAKTFGTGEENGTGNKAKKVKDFSNELFINMLKSSYATCAVVSQDNKDVIEVAMAVDAKYIVYFDALDGSSNIDCAVSIGSIFGIAKKPEDCDGVVTMEHCLLPGRNYIASGYALYGSSTVLVLTTGNGVDGFTLDPTIGEFLLTEAGMKIKPRGKIYSVNEGYTEQFSDPLKAYLSQVRTSTESRASYSSRYVGSMVADMHRTIKYGGIFIYPATRSNPNGKLHLLYECNPMAHLVEQAGGAASNGVVRLRDITPKTLHERQPIFIGSKLDVQDYLDVVTSLAGSL